MTHSFQVAIAALLSLICSTAAADYTPSLTYLRWAVQIQLHADGSYTKIKERHLRVDTEAGIEAAGEVRQGFVSSLETVEVLEAWSQSPDGQRHAVASDKIKTLEESDDGSADFSDSKINVVIFPALQVGSEIYVKYRIRQHTPFFAGHFAESLVVSPHHRFLNVSLDLVHDPALTLQWHARGFVGGPVATLPSDPAGSLRFRYSYQQPGFIPTELSSVAPSDFAPAVVFTTFKDYADLAKAYQAGSRPRSEPTPAIRQFALDLTAQAKTPRDKVRVLYNWVSRHIRYVSVSIGAGGYVPHDAQSIFDHRYGDCKDHVVILEALLRSVGIESSPVLVNADKAYRLPPVAVLSPFNHAITYVPSLHLFLDSTARFAPLGTLPEEVEDKPVLITASGQLAHTPRPDPKLDITLTRSRMQVTPSGSVVGTSWSTSGGSTQVVSRSAQYEYRHRLTERVVSKLLARHGETGTGEMYTPDPLDLDSDWRVEARFELDPVVNVPGPSAMTIPIGLGPADLHDLKKVRIQGLRALEFACSSAATYRDEIELRLPPKVVIERIPRNASIKLATVAYSAQYRRQGQTVWVVRQLTVDRGRSVCNARDEKDWAQVHAVLQRDLRAQVFFK